LRNVASEYGWVNGRSAFSTSMNSDCCPFLFSPQP
jgi:hypothetical protein